MSNIKSMLFMIVLLSIILPAQASAAFYQRDYVSSETLFNNLVTLTRLSHRKVKDKEYLKRLVWEAEMVVASEGNRWLTPQDLLGVALGESDFQWWIRTGKRWLPDCGIMQNHTPLYTRSLRERNRLCKFLKGSTWFSFVYGAQELNLYRNKHCLNPRSRHYVKKPIYRKGDDIVKFKKRYSIYKRNLYKCTFTLYNQGPNSRWAYNKYWLRQVCFVNSVEKGRYPGKNCRRMKSIGQLEYWLNKVK